MPTAHLEVTSLDLSGGKVPVDFTCDGTNAVPRLSWGEAPRDTRSFAVVVDDPDAPRPPFVHWLVWNIGPDQYKLDAPDAETLSQGTNGFGRVGWGGPCPPPGHKPHRYVFHVYALDCMLELDHGARREALIEAMRGHVLAEGKLIATYQRPPSRGLGEVPTHP